MDIIFANTRIEKLCLNPDVYAVKEGLPKQVVEELKLFMYRVRSFDNCADFFKPAHRRYNLEKLTNKKGLMSIRLDRKYRVTFYEKNRNEKLSFIEITGIEIENVSNHYK